MTTTLENRPTLSDYGPIVARLPDGWPASSVRKPLAINRLPHAVSLDEIATQEESFTKAASPRIVDASDFEPEGYAAESADGDAPVGDDEAEGMAIPEGAFADAKALGSNLIPVATTEMTLTDKLEAVLATIPNEVREFIEQEMRGRFMGVKAV